MRTIACSNAQRDQWARRMLALSLGLPSIVAPAFANGASAVPSQNLLHAASSAQTVLNHGSSPLAAQGTSRALNLNSAVPNLKVQNAGSSPVVINVGGLSQSFRPGILVTAAEFVAIQQVLNAGAQNIVLSKLGTAVGGAFSLNGAERALVTTIVIPKNVTAIDNVSKNSLLSFSGNLSNYGTIDAI